MMKNTTRAVVLAAGRSNRFNRKTSKLLTDICGRAMVLFPLKVLESLQIPTAVVLGYQADQVKACIEGQCSSKIDFILQPEALGTGHAVMCSQDKWDRDNILIMNGDMPLLSSELIEELLKKHLFSDAAISFVSTYVLNPVGYGRVIEKDNTIAIYEEKDCPEEFLFENKVNAGIYVVKRSFLEAYISKIQKSQKSGEFYITDLIHVASQKGLSVQVVPAPFDQVRGVNTLHELWAVEQIMRSNLIKHWMNHGVRFELAQNIHIDIDVEIGPDSFIGTGVHILGRTVIGEGCFIAAFSILENTVVGNGTNIHSHSVVQDSTIGENVHVGPFARLRNNVVLGDNVSVGNFVEMKNSEIGQHSKMKHLSYVGDAKVGNNVNIGAGTIFCNYDGYTKHQTIIEDDVFVGSNDTLIAPVKIEKGAYIAAGSTITKNVESNDLAIARARQENKKGYASRLKNKKKCDVSESHKKKEDKGLAAELKFHFLGVNKTYGGSEESL